MYLIVMLHYFFLQYDEGDIYEHFVQFYEDVLPEFSKAGKVVQFKVTRQYYATVYFTYYVL